MTEHVEPGEFVEKVPTRGDNRNGTPQHHLRVDKYGLDAMAVKAQERPHVPLLAGRDIPFKYTNSLRVRRRDPYLTRDGQIKVSIKSTGNHTDDGDRLVDVYFVWTPFPEIPNY